MNPVEKDKTTGLVLKGRSACRSQALIGPCRGKMLDGRAWVNRKSAVAVSKWDPLGVRGNQGPVELTDWGKRLSIR